MSDTDAEEVTEELVRDLEILQELSDKYRNGELVDVEEITTDVLDQIDDEERRATIATLVEDEFEGVDTGALSGILFVGTDGTHDTIMAAWEDARDGEAIVVLSSYDADEAGEEFPIVLDRSEREVSLVGLDPSGSVIEAGDHDGDVIRCIGRGPSDYRNSPYLAKLRINGGETGVKILGAPNAYFENVKVFGASRHGWQVSTNDDVGGSHGLMFQKCEAWTCGGVGFRLDRDANAHGSMFVRCNATWNGYADDGPHPGVYLTGYSSVWNGGTVQQNSHYGIHMERDGGIVVRDAYIESNGIEREGRPTQVYANGALGGLIEGCYFNGTLMDGSRRHSPTDHDRAERQITLQNCRTTAVRDCAYRFHEEGFIAVQGPSALDNDVYEASHDPVGGEDSAGPFWAADRGTRTRSGGVIRPTDLSEIEGKYEGDLGIDEDRGIAVWMGNEWRFESASGEDGSSGGGSSSESDSGPSIERHRINEDIEEGGGRARRWERLAENEGRSLDPRQRALGADRCRRDRRELVTGVGNARRHRPGVGVC